MFPLSQNPNGYVHSASFYGMLWLHMGHMIPNLEPITNYPRCSASLLVLVIQNHWCWPEPHHPAPQRVQSLAVSLHLSQQKKLMFDTFDTLKFHEVSVYRQDFIVPLGECAWQVLAEFERLADVCDH